MIARCISLLLAATLALAPVSGAAHARHKKRPGKQIVPITIVIDGTQLAVNPPPRFYKYHLLVPVRRTIAALGLTFNKNGRRIVTYAGSKTISLTIGSMQAEVDGEAVQLDAPPVEIQNTLYAPLRFFTAALGAQATFDRQTNSVTIVSTLIGRTGNGIVDNDGQVEAKGTVTAVDILSSPQTITITYGASVRTIPIESDATVVTQDVSTNTSLPADLSEIRPGDFAHVYLTREGQVKRIVDGYGSRSGTVAAAGSGEFVMNDGQVIVPARGTTIELNGEGVPIDAIRAGDDVTVDYNIETLEVRSILATRAAAATGTPAPARGPAIASIGFQPHQALRGGDQVAVTLHGTPSGNATYDIGTYILGLPLQESSPGIYTATYTVPRGVNFADEPIFGNLRVGGAQAPRAESQATLSVSNQPPGIGEIAPDAGATVNSNRPAIYATFVAGTVPVNPSSIRIEVDGQDVTAAAVRTPRFIDYMPEIDYRSGPVTVAVRVSDLAGNTNTKSWTFYIRG